MWQFQNVHLTGVSRSNVNSFLEISPSPKSVCASVNVRSLSFRFAHWELATCVTTVHSRILIFLFKSCILIIIFKNNIRGHLEFLPYVFKYRQIFSTNNEFSFVNWIWKLTFSNFNRSFNEIYFVSNDE